MSDANNDQKQNNEWRKLTHPTHFPTPDFGAKSDVAIKHDQNKTEYHHMPPEAFEEVNKVFTFGAKKYAAYNYRAGFSYSRPFNAAMRHMWAYWRGEDLDKETSISHLAHAICCVLILLQNVLENKGKDDRFKK